MGFRSAYSKNHKRTTCCYCHRKLLPTSMMDSPDPFIRGQVTSVEHIEPRSNGGTNDPDNLDLACQRCNSMRGHLPHPIFNMFAQQVLRHHPNAPRPYLAGALQNFIYDLAGMAIRNKAEARRAISLTKDRLEKDLRRANLL